MRQPLWVVLGVVASLILVGLAGGVLWMGARMMRRAAAVRSAPIVYTPSAHPKSMWPSTPPTVPDDPDIVPEPSPKLPDVKRAVPVFDVRILAGCSKSDLDSIETSITSAIGVGAPLYNSGQFGACYRTYDDAARAIEHDVGKTCKGPATSLADGRARAASRATPAEQAWAMRDEFDGLLDVIDRRGAEL